MTVDYTNPDTLHKMYHTHGMSQHEIADKAGVSQKTIYRWMKRHNINARPSTHERHGHHVLEDKRGYERVEVTVDGKTKAVSIHRLAAVAWFGTEAVEGKDVHHKSGCKIDNRECNMELLTREEHNKRHA